MTVSTLSAPTRSFTSARGLAANSDGDGQAICPIAEPQSAVQWFGYEPQSRDHHANASNSAAGTLQAQPENASAPTAPHRIRLLLADDHAIFRQGLAALLGDFQDLEIVAQASDGSMALELARSTKPDVAILDLSMPKLSGIEVAKRLHRELPDVRVIGLSMHDEKDMAASMVRAGASTYLTKDGPSESLIAAIRKLGHSRQAG